MVGEGFYISYLEGVGGVSVAEEECFEFGNGLDEMDWLALFAAFFTSHVY